MASARFVFAQVYGHFGARDSHQFRGRSENRILTEYVPLPAPMSVRSCRQPGNDVYLQAEFLNAHPKHISCDLPQP